MARKFNGTSDTISTSLGGLGFAFGPGTIATVARVTGNGNTRTMFQAGPDVSTPQYGLYRGATNFCTLYCGGVASTSTTTVLAADGWVLMAATKATDSVLPRLHIHKYAAKTWFHENGAANVANSTAPVTNGYIGSRALGASTWFVGDVAIVGVWDVVLTDSQIESLAKDLSVSNWNGYTKAKGLWVLDQPTTGTNVVDLSGNGANQSALAGTVVSPDDMPLLRPTVQPPAKRPRLLYRSPLRLGRDPFTPFHAIGGAGTVNATITGVQATATAAAQLGTPTILLPGAQATGTAAAQLGVPAVNPTGVQATATAAAQAGGTSLTVGGVQATSTAAMQLGTPAVKPTGVQATATASAQAGGTTLTLAGAQATATAGAQLGAPTISITAQATATAAGQAGGTTLTIGGAQATATAAGQAGTPAVKPAGAQATATASGQPGGTSLTIGGAQATATAAGQTGVPTILVTGAQATGTAVAQPGTVTAGGGTTTITGVASTATAAGQLGTPRVSATGTQATSSSVGQPGTPTIQVAGAQAVGSSVAQAGAPKLLIDGAQATATSIGQPGVRQLNVTITGARAAATADAAPGYVHWYPTPPILQLSVGSRPLLVVVQINP